MNRHFEKIARTLMLLLASLAGGLVPASAQSFSCDRAQTVQEKAICGDPQLQATDAKMGAAYQRLRASLSPAAAAEVQQDQRAWLAYLNKVCPEKPYNGRMRLQDCILGEEDQRIEDLTQYPAEVSGLHLFTRLTVVTVPNTEKSDSVADPGFGIARLCWPEIDHPTEAQAAFNRAVKAAAYRIVSSSEGAQPGVISPEDVADNTTHVVYGLTGLNSHFAGVQFEGYANGYGAAHPNEIFQAFTWSFDKSRAVTERDVFAPASPWKEKLGALAQSLLKKQQAEGDRELLNAEPELTEGVASTVVEPTNWILTRAGLTIHFPEYAVAPRMAGTFSVTVPWQPLGPLLAAGFDPALLPVRLPQKPAGRPAAQ